MTTVTLGGLTAGFSLITINCLRWWLREQRRIAALVPFLLALAYGIVAVLSAGGLLGGLAHITLWGANGLGDLSLVYGVGGHTRDVTRVSQQALTDGGHAVVVLMTVVLICLCIWSKRLPIWKVAGGAIAGVSLGLVGSIAGAAAVPLASGVNFAGSIFTVMR
jgi:hypothetical protein